MANPTIRGSKKKSENLQQIFQPGETYWDRHLKQQTFLESTPCGIKFFCRTGCAACCRIWWTDIRSSQWKLSLGTTRKLFNLLARPRLRWRNKILDKTFLCAHTIFLCLQGLPNFIWSFNIRCTHTDFSNTSILQSQDDKIYNSIVS